MTINTMTEEVTVRLYAKTVQDLRRIARALSVRIPTNGKKEEVIAEIMRYANGSQNATPRSARGAPPKSHEYDVEVAAAVERCREYCLALIRGEEMVADNELRTLSDGLREDGTCAGILERAEKSWFLRMNGCRISGRDVAVQESFVTRFDLREGDFVVGVAERKEEQGYGLLSVSSVNGERPDARGPRTNYADLTARFPEKQLVLTRGKDDLAGRILDFFTPLGAGQRALVAGGARTGKTELLLSIGAGICLNYPQICTVALLLGARPEEEYEFSKNLVGGKVFSTALDDGDYAHHHAAALALKFVKRCVECGKEVVFLVDGLNALLTRDGNDGSEIVKLLSAAGNFGEVSLTVVGAWQSRGGVAESALLGGATMGVFLSEEYAAMRLYPAIDVKKSFTARPERLVDGGQIEAATELRVKYSGAEGQYRLIGLFRETPDNAALVGERD